MVKVSSPPKVAIPLLQKINTWVRLRRRILSRAISSLTHGTNLIELRLIETTTDEPLF